MGGGLTWDVGVSVPIVFVKGIPAVRQKIRRHPHLYEANARIFLKRISERYGRELTLAAIPDEEWQVLDRRGFDLVWLMGVWQRSPSARREALLDVNLRREYDEALPGWTEGDVAGSPYAVHSYVIDSALGSERDLMELRARLNRRGLGLVLDFVPNHLALDHPWVSSHPDRFVQGDEADAATHHDWFFSPDGRKHLAHGRDPNFAPWTDTAQLNFFSAELRQALIEELLQIATVADGVRCDMAMLALNGVFEQVWGGVLKDHARLVTEFWADAIGAVRKQHPDFIFLAEAYWGLERELQEMGFDFTYDKPFYDRLRFSSPADIHKYLGDKNIRHERGVRFIENHDEPRSRVVLGRERCLAAAIVLATVPGLRLFQDGQLEGLRIHLPVQLVREPRETADSEITRFYDRLLTVCNAPAFHEGEWVLLEATPGGEGNHGHQNLLAWSWCSDSQLMTVIINYSADRSQGRLVLPIELEKAGGVALQDELGGETYMRDANELRSQGLYVDLDPWRAHILNLANGRPLVV